MTLRYETANLDFTTGAAKDRAHLRELCARNDVLLLQECKNIDVQRLLPEGWIALQDLSDAGRAGSVIACRTARVYAEGFKLHLGSRPWLGRRSRPGRRQRRAKMLTRWIATAHLTDRLTGETFFGISAHLPKKAFAWLRRGYARRLRAIVATHPRTVLGVDANMPIRELAAQLGLKAHGEGIIGILAGPYIRTAGDVVIHRHGRRQGWTDHVTVQVPVRDASRQRSAT